MIGNANQITGCTATTTLAVSGLAANASTTFNCSVPGLRAATDRVIGVSMTTPPDDGIVLSAGTIADGVVEVVLFNGTGGSLTTTDTVDVIILVCRCDNFIGDGL